MIDFHFCPTPNCWKVAIMLQEVQLPYNIIPYDIFKGEQLAPEFRAINPNNKLPAIVDKNTGAEPITVFESGAILYYLAEKSQRFLPTEIGARMRVMQWLAWQIAGLGPMIGQASHFLRYAPERHEYSIARYTNECVRLVNVLEYRLRRSEYLADDYSIADMAVWPLANVISLVGVERSDYPAMDRWLDVIAQRPAIERVFSSRETAVDPSYLRASRSLTAEEWSNTYGERMLAAARVD